jgi:hypothetical protein
MSLFLFRITEKKLQVEQDILYKLPPPPTPHPQAATSEVGHSDIDRGWYFGRSTQYRNNATLALWSTLVTARSTCFTSKETPALEPISVFHGVRVSEQTAIMSLNSINPLKHCGKEVCISF